MMWWYFVEIRLCHRALVARSQRYKFQIKWHPRPQYRSLIGHIIAHRSSMYVTNGPMCTTNGPIYVLPVVPHVLAMVPCVPPLVPCAAIGPMCATNDHMCAANGPMCATMAPVLCLPHLCPPPHASYGFCSTGLRKFFWQSVPLFTSMDHIIEDATYQPLSESLAY